VPAIGRREAAGGTVALDRWGADSEYGRLRDVLLSDPGAFRWLGAENAAYSALVRDTLRRGHRFDRELALRQHAEMVDAFASAGVAVHLLDAHDELAYGVYTRDSSIMTPWGAVVCQLANPRRRGEYATCLDFYARNGIPIYDLATAGNFEGGDFSMVAPGSVLVGYTGVRTEEVGARQVGSWLEREGYDVCYAPMDEFYVHLDLMVCMLAPGLAAVCLETTDPEVVSWLGSRGIEVVPVGFRETLGLGCNVVALGGDRVLSSAFATELNAKLRALGLTVYDPDMSQFQLAGGGVHCLCQPLARDPG
jgi:N-dimethylarginine dimethylaminohydrolase